MGQKSIDCKRQSSVGFRYYKRSSGSNIKRVRTSTYREREIPDTLPQTESALKLKRHAWKDRINHASNDKQPLPQLEQYRPKVMARAGTAAGQWWHNLDNHTTANASLHVCKMPFSLWFGGSAQEAKSKSALVLQAEITKRYCTRWRVHQCDQPSNADLPERCPNSLT